MSGTIHFYEALPVHDDIRDITDPDVYTDVPPDWYVVLADIRDSTAAVQQGRYKEVNIIGAACIMAVLNAVDGTDVPYVFGGDGATLLVPEIGLTRAEHALAGVRATARDAFQLGLRVAIVPVRHVLEAGYELRVARFRMASDYSQAMFTGGGVRYVDRLVKDDVEGRRFLLPASEEGEADYRGLECRWEDIPSRHGETVTLIVTALEEDGHGVAAAYKRVIDAVHDIYGHEDAHRPVVGHALRETYSIRRLSYEAKLRASATDLSRCLYIIKIFLQNVLLKLFLVFNISTGDTHWRGYVDRLVRSVDYRKFDDALRMVIVGSEEQRRGLQVVLDAEFKQGTLAYGMSVADRAHLTCMVFERMGRQVHFLDGADGGYTLAARDLKRRKNER